MIVEDAARKKDQPLFGTSHAAGLLGCDPTTLRDYAQRGIASPRKTSTGRHLWSMDDLRAIEAYRGRRTGK